MWPKSYAERIRRAVERLSTYDTRTIDWARGTVRYAERGSGIPLLVSHGIVGGYEENQKVEFAVTEGPKGPQAANVRPVA